MELFNASWKVLLVRGLVGVLFGVVAVAWPVSTVAALVVLWGIWALADGIGLVLQAFREGTAGQRVWAGILAVVAVLAGLYAILRPGATAAVLTWVIGAWLLVRAVVETVSALRAGLPGSTRALTLLGALVDLVLGLIFVTHPGKSAVGAAVVLGIVALVWGVVLVILALVLRNHLEDLAPGGPVQPA
jgi:uncharacterized membrane protein HdeD (DUF308 family)